MGRLDGRAVLFVIAHREFRDEELQEPRRLVEAEGARTAVASSAIAPALGMLGAEVAPDLLYSAVKVEEWDALVFVGGNGASEYWDDRTAHRLALDAVARGKALGAICFAVSTLAQAGVLEGRRATAWPGRKDHLLAKGVLYTGAPVTTDGRIVTGAGPQASLAFARALVEAIAT